MGCLGYGCLKFGSLEYGCLKFGHLGYGCLKFGCLGYGCLYMWVYGEGVFGVHILEQPVDMLGIWGGLSRLKARDCTHGVCTLIGLSSHALETENKAG